MYPRVSRGNAMKLHGAVIIVAGTLIAHGQAQGQDLGARALSGTASLSAGFTPDPHRVGLIVGGPNSVARLGSDCVGCVSQSDQGDDDNGRKPQASDPNF